MEQIKNNEPLTAYIIKCGFSADNQHYHPQKPRCFSQENTTQSAPNHIRGTLAFIAFPMEMVGIVD